MDNHAKKTLNNVYKWSKMGLSGEKWGMNNVLVYSTPLKNPNIFMFIGEYSHTLDDKGRLSVPKKFRSDLEGGAVVTRGLDHCLFLYTRNEWEKLAEKLANLPFAQANTRAFARLMLAGAMDVEVDKQGRIVLPEYLRDYGSIQKDVVIAGLYNRLEIWNEQKWKDYTQKTENESNEIAEQMSQLGV